MRSAGCQCSACCSGAALHGAHGPTDDAAVGACAAQAHAVAWGCCASVYAAAAVPAEVARAAEAAQAAACAEGSWRVHAAPCQNPDALAAGCCWVHVDAHEEAACGHWRGAGAQYYSAGLACPLPCVGLAALAGQAWAAAVPAGQTGRSERVPQRCHPAEQASEALVLHEACQVLLLLILPPAFQLTGT